MRLVALLVGLGDLVVIGLAERLPFRELLRGEDLLHRCIERFVRSERLLQHFLLQLGSSGRLGRDLHAHDEEKWRRTGSDTTRVLTNTLEPQTLLSRDARLFTVRPLV